MAADLRLLSRAVPVALLALLPAEGLSAEDPCARATSKAVVVDKDEPGTRLRIRGVVYRPDGMTPAAGVILYVYQTDASGLYAKKPGNPPRLRAWMRTDDEGRYEFLTIRPAPYPNRSVPAHIHTQLWGPGTPPQWNVEMLFGDDPLVSQAQIDESVETGRFSFVKTPLYSDDGFWSANYNIRLKAGGDTFEQNILHGVKPCGLTPPSRPS